MFSPDGQRIVFSRGDTIGESRLITGTLVEEGGQPDLVELREIGRGSEPAWSPNGRKIAFVDLGGVKVLDLSTNKVTLVSRDVGLEDPAWERDGGSLIVTSIGSLGLFRLTPGTLLLERLTRGRDGQPATGQDGKVLFSRAQIDGTCAIYALADSGEIKRLTDGSTCDMSPSIASDGKTIAFTRMPGIGRDIVAATVDAELYVREGEDKPMRLTNNRAWDGDNAWAPRVEMPRPS